MTSLIHLPSEISTQNGRISLEGDHAMSWTTVFRVRPDLEMCRLRYPAGEIDSLQRYQSQSKMGPALWWRNSRLIQRQRAWSHPIKLELWTWARLSMFGTRLTSKKIQRGAREEWMGNKHRHVSFRLASLHSIRSLMFPLRTINSHHLYFKIRDLLLRLLLMIQLLLFPVHSLSSQSSHERSFQAKWERDQKHMT